MTTQKSSTSTINSPTITTFSPQSGPVGTLVTIQGSNLQNASEVSIGGPAIIISNTASQIVAMVMPGAGTGPITVVVEGVSTATGESFEADNSSGPFEQEGGKLVGSGYTGSANQGIVAVSADGNTAVVGGANDGQGTGAIWIFTRTAGVWSQQGNKLVGTNCIGATGLGTAVAISADGNTVIVGGSGDNLLVGAAWIFTRTDGVWSQQGNKLVGSNYLGNSLQGCAVAISADGNTVAIGGNGDNFGVGATWIFTRSAGIWSQLGEKLVGSGFVGKANQGSSLAMSADALTIIVGSVLMADASAPVWVFINNAGWQQQGNYLTASQSINNAIQQNTALAVSADGNTFILGENQDNGQIGAAWVFTRSAGIWSQQSGKLIGTGAVGNAAQGQSVSISADGNTAIVGGNTDNGDTGAVWVYRRTANIWTQSGNKLVGTGATGNAFQGNSVALSADGQTILSGGFGDNNLVGATWVFVQAQPAKAV